MSLSQAERNIFLVNPRTPNSKTIEEWRFGVPAGLGVVGSMAERARNTAGFPENEVGLKVVDENLGQIIDLREGDLVLVSAFSLATRGVKTLIRKVNDKGGFAVVGGIHATEAPDDFSKGGGISFRGEAGNSAVFNNDVLRQWLNRGELERGQNIVSEGLTDPQTISLANLPVSGEIYRALDEKTSIKATFTTMGCPHNCGFCTVMAGRVVRKRPVAEIGAEIKLRGLDQSGFVLADSNLGAGGKAHLNELLGEFAKLKLPRGWTSEISLDLLDRGGKELLEALKKAHCQRLFVGIESPNQENLISVGKKHNLPYSERDVGEIVKTAHQQGIKITGLFIVGFPTETMESIRKIEEYIANTQLDGANIFILTPLPGTRIWDEFRDKGLFDPQTLNTDHLDLKHLVFNHPLGDEKLLEEYERLCRRVFSAPAVFSRGTRAFFMSWSHHLPKNLWQAVLSSYIAEILQADEHRMLGLIDKANTVYNAWMRLRNRACL